METKVLTEDEFYAQFDPIPGPDGSDWWGNFQDIPKDVPVERIWSVADGMGGCIAMSGCHVVNVFAHMVTKVPWTEDIVVNLDWRNEWFFNKDLGCWVQDASQFCMINRPETTHGVQHMMESWDEHQWLRPSKDLIIGVPPSDGPLDSRQYLIVFSRKEVR